MELTSTTTTFRPTKINVLTANVRGITSAKMIKLRSIMADNHIDITIITESKKELNQQLIGQGKPLWIEGSSGLIDGVAAIYPSGKGFSVLKKSNRIIVLESPGGLWIIGAYGVPETAKHELKLEFWRNLKETTMSATLENKEFIVIGDLNAGHESIRGGKKPDGGNNYPRLVEFMDLFNMHALTTGLTWKSERAQEPTRTLDRCLARKDTPMEMETKLDWLNALSDHALLFVKIKDISRNRNIGRTRGYARLDMTSMDAKWSMWRSELLKKCEPMTSSTNNVESILMRFWDLRRAKLLQQRDPLTLIDENGLVLQPESAIKLIRGKMQELWSTEERQQLQTIAYVRTSEPPSVEEINDAASKLCDKSAVGCDKVPSNIMKINPKAAEIYQRALEEVWNSGTIPTAWKTMKVKPIPKENSKCLVTEIRPITCLSTSTKILNKIIAKRTEDLYEKCLSGDQHAYRKQRSTWSAKQQLKDEIVRRKTCVATFIDLSKAFDRVTREALVDALDHWAVTGTERSLILEQYKESEVKIEYAGKTAPLFTHDVGVRQGCVLSGLIFNIVMAKIHREVEEGAKGMDLALISYSDDFMAITDNLATAGSVLQLVKQAVKRSGLVLNDKKTIMMEFDTSQPSKGSAKWLGTYFETGLGWATDVKFRIEKAKTAMKELKDLIRENKMLIPTTVMLQIINALITVHLKVVDMIKVTREENELLENCLLEAVLENTNLRGTNAESRAREMLHGRNEMDLEALGKLVTLDGEKCFTYEPHMTFKPDREYKAFRKTKIVELKEQRKWCYICDPPTRPKQLSRHRLKEHRMNPLEKLMVKCKDCRKVSDPTSFITHECRGHGFADTAVYCPQCHGPFTQQGLNRHSTSCVGLGAEPVELEAFGK